MPKVTIYISKADEKEWKAASRDEREDIGNRLRSLIRRRLAQRKDGRKA